MDGYDLGAVVNEHRRWLDTAGAAGRRAAFGAARRFKPFVTDDGRTMPLSAPRPAALTATVEALRAHGLKALDLRGADFSGAELGHVDFSGSRLDGADFTGANLAGARLDDAQLGSAIFTRAVLDEASLAGAFVNGGRLEGALLRRANLTRCSLERAVLDGADLSGCTLVDARCTGASFNGARMAGADCTGAALQATRWEHARAAGCILERADLSSAVLRFADLAGARLHDASAEHADLTSATLSGAAARGLRAGSGDFAHVDLRGADLAGARLARARFRGADLRDASLEQADASEAEFVALHLLDARRSALEVRPTVLEGVRWTGARLAWARFDAAAGAQVPHAVLHPFRDTVRIDGEPMKKTEVFICHASEDIETAGRIYDHLVAAGFSPWMDKRDLRPGQFWREEIPRRIRAVDAVIICFSNVAVKKRGYVQNEFKLALEETRNLPSGTVFVIPVRLDECDVPDEFERLHREDLWLPGALDRIVDAVRGVGR